MEEQSEYITATTTATLAPQLGGTVLVDPATLGDGPCEIHRLDEDYWREILAAHWPYGLGTKYWQCHCMDTPEVHAGDTADGARDAWVTHVLHIAAITPEPYRGGSDA